MRLPARIAARARSTETSFGPRSNGFEPPGLIATARDAFFVEPCDPPAGGHSCNGGMIPRFHRAVCQTRHGAGDVRAGTAGPRGPLDRVAQIADHKYCRPHA